MAPGAQHQAARRSPAMPTVCPGGQTGAGGFHACLFSVPIETKLKWRWQKKIKASVKESTRNRRARVGHGGRLMDKEGRKKKKATRNKARGGGLGSNRGGGVPALKSSFVGHEAELISYVKLRCQGKKKKKKVENSTE